MTAVLDEHGERIHPASAWLANESAHIASESDEHELNAFQAIRRMDEILINNFMVFHEVVETGEYDLVIGDEAWDVDYYLHENPEIKRTAFAWLTDFVGWLPMPDGGDREAYLTADYNAEMIEQVERFPRIRDRAIFVGDPDDIVPDDFGPDLPDDPGLDRAPLRLQRLRDRVRSGPARSERRGELRRELGYRDDERVVVVTVGGSGVGESLLRRRRRGMAGSGRRVNGLRMIVVAGPRIDPDSLDAPVGVEVRPFVPDLYRHLAACDLAVVQGGLTTTMELDRGAAALPVLPAAQPLRAEPPRAAPPRTLWRRPVHGRTTRRRRRSSPQRSPRRSIARSTTVRSSRTVRPAPPRSLPRCFELRAGAGPDAQLNGRHRDCRPPSAGSWRTSSRNASDRAWRSSA